MNITLQAKSFHLSERLKHYSKNKINASLAGLDNRLTSVDISFLGINGPRGGKGNLSQIHVTVDGLPVINVAKKRKQTQFKLNRHPFNTLYPNKPEV